MAVNTKPMFVGKTKGTGTTWTNSDAAATKKTVFTAAASEGSLLTALAVTSSDTSDRVFNLYLNDGSTDFLIGSKSVSAATGTAAAPSLNFMADTITFPFLSPDGLLVPYGWAVKLENVTQVTAAKTVTFVALGGDFVLG